MRLLGTDDWSIMGNVWIVGVAALVLVNTGCSSGVKAVPVSGKVTLDGKPLASANVAFQPDGVRAGVELSSVGVTDAGGVYSLKLMGNDQAGAVVGKHRVEINLVVASDDRDPRTRPPTKTLPAKYNRNSELNFEVPAGGTDQANFELKEK